MRRIPVLLFSLFCMVAPLAVRADESGGFRIRTLSTRPEMVTGGDVLVRVDVPPGTDLGQVKVFANESDVSAAFFADASGRTLTGLVKGLELGENTLSVRGAGEDEPGAEISIVNHSITGPVFSGPHEQPFICETATFDRHGLPGLGAPLDDQCSTATRSKH